MNKASVFFKTVFTIILIFTVIVFSIIFVLNQKVSDSYKVTRGESLTVEANVPITATSKGAALTQSDSLKTVGDVIKVDLKLFGIIPVRSVDVEIVDEMYVSLLGQPFGMKLYTQGVLVINYTDVDTKTGKKNPAKDAGIKMGDYILSVNGNTITTNEELSEYVELSNGEAINLELMRDGKKFYANIKPEFSSETNSYKLGLWVRDSSAGIGTLTFYSPISDIVCGLGHGICDSDTNELLELESGEMVTAKILSVTKGKDGNPGELHGQFLYNSIADILLNCEIGVYGKLNSNIDVSRLVEVGLKQEIKDGKAQIYCTVDGETPQYYDCTIKKRTSAYFSKEQNMVVTITDKELLEKTGGIVQGMSGSPIIQNGKLIGAVTHVLIDDSTKGYAVFAENMLETAQNVGEGLPLPQDKQLKEAS